MEPVHNPHAYSLYESLVRTNVSQFHRNFNARHWRQNGDLVIEDLHVNANGREFCGRDKFVEGIQRFLTPFPDIKITDLTTVVDGNAASIRFVITGTHEGDLDTPEGIIHATHKAIKVDGIEFFTFNEEALLIDLVTVEDLASMIKQVKSDS